MNQNYCYVDKNKIYGEIYDELLDEELSMNNSQDNNKIKAYIEKKIIKEKYINLSEFFVDNKEIISDLILKITSDVSNDNLQGNTMLLYADLDEMYELFYLEDLTKSHINYDCDLNEFASITNIHLLPIYWGGGIFKSTYSNGIIKGDIIKKEDLAKLFIQNFYHQGVMIGINGELTPIEFTGEDPFRVIGNNFTQSNPTNIIGFNIVSYIEKGYTDTDTDTNINNEFGSKLLEKEIKGRVFISVLCPTTNKKFWNINIKTISNIMTILNNENLSKQINRELDLTDKDINPFYLVNKILMNHK